MTDRQTDRMNYQLLCVSTVYTYDVSVSGVLGLSVHVGDVMQFQSTLMQFRLNACQLERKHTHLLYTYVYV